MLIAAWTALLTGAVIGTVAFGNNDALGYTAFSAYILAVVAVLVISARQSLRRGHPVRRLVTRCAKAVLLIHIPLVPFVLVAMAM